MDVATEAVDPLLGEGAVEELDGVEAIAGVIIGDGDIVSVETLNGAVGL